ncbi:heparan-alpha-glucosaminide N-acetyltransferase [uncultured Ruminococcus sp.]|uniref:heparan-alpha-glucosaminide N-acetyltransferase n=1 Tax=uncultured Ruminococcus sp. TaxID=165186 RepID=UPI0025DD8970|nr:heparan-alpha-glucosaminide N-acetyltransferase [uncultured Ruminococcus sp.]
MQKSISAPSVRYHLIDALRGFALVNMVIFHLMYDIFNIFSAGTGWNSEPLTIIWERFICCSFIILSGVSFNFSHHPFKRGIILNACGFLITIVTVLVIPSQAVWFGILNFLGCAMMLAYPLKEYLENIKPAVGAVCSLLLFAFLYGVPDGYVGFFGVEIFSLPEFLYGTKALAFIGFPSADFHSTDYFPIIPWIFLFLSGCFAWRVIKNCNADSFFKRKVPFFDLIGRHTLIIYLLHQPIIMTAVYVISGFSF